MLRQPVCKSRQRCADSITAEFQTYSRINISIKTVGREPHVINLYGLTAPVMRMQVSTFIHIVYVEAQTTFHPFILFHLFLSASWEPGAHPSYHRARLHPGQGGDYINFFFFSCSVDSRCAWHFVVNKEGKIFMCVDLR